MFIRVPVCLCECVHITTPAFNVTPATSQFINTLQKVRKSCFVLTTQKALTKAYACCPTTQGSIKVSISALLCLRVDRVTKEPERKSQQDGVEQCEAKLQRKVHGRYLLLIREYGGRSQHRAPSE